MPIEIRKKAPTKEIFAALRGLTHNEVLVGVPAETAGREPEPGEDRTLNNAEIGYVLEFGSTIKHPGGTEYVQDASGKASFVKSGTVEGAKKTAAHEIVIPPRPHLRPAIEEAKDKLAAALGAGVHEALAGLPDAADKALHAAGLIGQNAVRNKITEGPFAPLAPRTLAERRKRGRTGTKPLLDTGAYRNSQTYVVRPKDKR